MSRKARELRLEAESRWPLLCQFLGGYLHQDWPEEYGSTDAAIDAAIADSDFAHLQNVVREWWDWNSTSGWHNDVDSVVVEGLGAEVSFDSPADARDFMGGIYEKLIVTIRKEVKGWKP